MQRQRVPVVSPLGATIGYSRAVRAGDLVFVAGTTATSPDGGALHPGDAGKQTEVILERIGAALRELGASMEDVVETRIYVTDMSLWPAVGAAHGAVFKDIRPASTLVQVGPLIFPGLLVEISAIAATA
ncbi:MAG TPA: RidA family protein [Acetobacteraceae bacterium]|jgi:enamine deaminase RidA (YjgF/YER057c/UK114 family)|nr:RidA family protein [Acetobacteraceae bacterium]